MSEQQLRYYRDLLGMTHGPFTLEELGDAGADHVGDGCTP